MAIKILDVGQCRFDGPRMAALWQEKLGASVDRVASGDEAVRHAAKNEYDLILVNRVLDADHSSGLDVIQQLLSGGATAPVMLVSDLPDAQDAAVALGAVRGFGKEHLDKKQTLELVKRTAETDRKA